MSKRSKEILDKIEASKEILSTMPQNNIKNIKIYQSKITELKEEYEKYKKDVANKLQKRYQNAMNTEENKEIENLQKKLEAINWILEIIDTQKTSYEKMGLDKSIYTISRYYKDNLENINEQIKQCIDKFKKVGIKLSLDDFKYSIYAQEYMKVFFQEAKNGDINSDKLKKKFEEIYWKCPEILIHIELNLRNIYLDKQQQIDKFFEIEKAEKLRKLNITSKEIRDNNTAIKKQIIEIEETNSKKIQQEFIYGKLNIKDFYEDKINAEIQKILVKKVNVNEEIQNNIYKFLNSLYEYRNYKKFEFIVNDLKKHYKERENYKKVYDTTKKEIEKLEKNLKNLNKKSTQRGLFRTKNISYKQTPEFKEVIQTLKEKYKQLDKYKFYNKIYLELNENSTIYDALKLASSYYIYLTTCIISNFENITQEEIDEKVNELNQFINNPFNTIITNINLVDETDISLVIKDRYKLLNFNVEKEDFEQGAIESYITKLENIKKSIILKKLNLKIKEIEQLCEIKKILQL